MKVREICEYETLNAMFVSIKQQIPYFWKRVNDKQAYIQKLVEKAYVFKIESDDNEMIGFVVFYANNMQTKTAFISFIFVDEIFRKMNYGSMLLEIVEKISAEQGMKRILLEVRKNNTVAINFYKKNLFYKVNDKETETNDTVNMVKEIG